MDSFFVVDDLHAPRAVFNLKRLLQLKHCRKKCNVVPWVWCRLSPCFAELKHKIHYPAIQNMLLPKVELAWGLKTSTSHYTVTKNRVHQQHKTAFVCWILIAYLEKGQSSFWFVSVYVCVCVCVHVFLWVKEMFTCTHAFPFSRNSS